MKNICILMALFFNVSKAEIVGVYDLSNKREVKYVDFLLKVKEYKNIVLGEFHYNPPIQSAHGKLIEDISNASSAKSIAVMWEFLDYTDQNKINENYAKVLNSDLSVDDFLKQIAGEQNVAYAPIVWAAKNANASFIGLNLPRSLKQKVIASGIESLDTKFIPPNYSLGGQNYFDRFEESMGGHTSPEKLQRYYIAQCLTDSVMSYTAYLNQKELNFIIAGSFHTDFFDGTVQKLNNLVDNNVVSLKIINVKDLTNEELDAFKENDEKYGQYADFLILTRNE